VGHVAVHGCVWWWTVVTVGGRWGWAVITVGGVVLGHCPLCRRHRPLLLLLCHCLLVGHIRWIGLGVLTVHCIENGK